MTTDILSLPETERLAAVLATVRKVQNDSEAVAKIMLRMRTTPDDELRDRWRPIVQEATDRVVDASKVLERTVRELKRGQRKPMGWSRGDPRGGWLHALVMTSGALTDLLARLQAYEIEGRSIAQFNSLRLRTLMQLPAEARDRLMLEESLG